MVGLVDLIISDAKIESGSRTRSRSPSAAKLSPRMRWTQLVGDETCGRHARSWLKDMPFVEKKEWIPLDRLTLLLCLVQIDRNCTAHWAPQGQVRVSHQYALYGKAWRAWWGPTMPNPYPEYPEMIRTSTSKSSHVLSHVLCWPACSLHQLENSNGSAACFTPSRWNA